ncbi:DUF6538 domain-containing protein [Methylobacterium brachythecii]|uniref:Integrase n=1 Tax=Methylobacterium brachythecii TaxID=1176177 RepID=A0A7W6AIU2_9HYPH|nr:DUF6538 domain-containing protein [Methylobacterium brachythecii]MBB3904137.1 integrase [Methylobacterium brachythecii]GLS42879.1 hypothetical protein GCM10007884_08640 [Methylobacterium brachythecii]
MVLGISRPWRHPKTHTYWFRRRVPKELLFLVGRTEERKSLRTKEPTVARTQYLLTAIEVEERWSLLRRAAGALASAASDETPAGIARSLPGPPEPPPTAPSSRKSAPWRGTFEAYAKDAALAPSTVKRWTGVFVALEEACGTDDLELVTRDDLIGWKRDLLASGRDPRTVRDAYVAAVKALMNWAVAEGCMTANPAADIVVAVPDKPTTRDRDFTDGEAYAILRASLAPQDTRLSREHAAARRWIPWLCAYGGARVNEMTQLRGSDVRVENGIPFLRITPEAGSVKNRKWRDVPVHPHLVEQGFLAFAKERGPGPLFYDPARGRNGQAAHPIYKKVGERLAAWVRSIGVDDPGVDPNHGWRHRFKTVGRRAGIDGALLDAIQGHAPRTEGERYGRFPVDVMMPAVARMPRYDLAKERQDAGPG